MDIKKEDFSERHVSMGSLSTHPPTHLRTRIRESR